MKVERRVERPLRRVPRQGDDIVRPTPGEPGGDHAVGRVDGHGVDLIVARRVGGDIGDDEPLAAAEAGVQRPAAVYRATAKSSRYPPLDFVPCVEPAATILPRLAVLVASIAIAYAALPGRFGVMAVVRMPPEPKVVSRLRSGLYRATAKAELETFFPALPATTILPSAWTPTPYARSSPAPRSVVVVDTLSAIRSSRRSRLGRSRVRWFRAMSSHGSWRAASSGTPSR